jgi:hypothetical protein
MKRLFLTVGLLLLSGGIFAQTSTPASALSAGRAVSVPVTELVLDEARGEALLAATEIGQVVVTGVTASNEMRRSPIPTIVVNRTQLN